MVSIHPEECEGDVPEQTEQRVGHISGRQDMHNGDREYLTPLGRGDISSMLDGVPKVATELLHDLVLRAARHRSNVSMLCSSLRPRAREEYYGRIAKMLFADSLREVMAVGGNVRILVWNAPQDGLVADSIKSLVGSQQASNLPGKLDIRMSGTARLADSIPHFVLAHGSEFWGLRVEDPHPVPDLDKKLTDDTKAMAAAATFGDGVRREAEPLLDSFNRLFEAAQRWNPTTTPQSRT